MKEKLSKEERLALIRSKVENLIEKNEKEAGTGKRIDEIEGELLGGILEIGKLLFEGRIEEEESALEEKGYEITGKKK